MPSRKCQCGGIVRDGKCNRCKTTKQPHERERGTSAARGYDNQWRLFSERYRVENPLCLDCLENGQVTPSREVHHIRKVKDRPDLKFTQSNLVALCKECHQVRTARGE